MYKSLSFYCFIALLNSLCNLKNVFSDETSPVTSSFRGKYTSGISNYEVVIPQLVNEDGSLISHLVSHRHSKRSTKESEIIFYKIPIEGKDYVIKLTPNKKLISPGAVIEKHKDNIEKSTNSSNNETVGEMFKNIDIQKLKNTDCHFSGTVKGENISKAAISTCYGLAGFIQISKGFYTIEPAADQDPLVEDGHPHILYKTDGLENSSICQTLGELSASLVRRRRENSIGLSPPMFVETLLVMDKTLINHHQELDCENYVLTVFNMADNLFRDTSTGLMISLTVVRIIRLEVESNEMNLKVNEDAEKTLKYFQNWQHEINPGDDSHPNHHDLAILITKVCYSQSCGLLGLSTIGKACDPKLSAALCEDNGLRLGYVIAHEIGHLLGADHDMVNCKCNGTDENGLKTVMHPEVPMSAHTWSPCSKAYFEAFFRSGKGNCFRDEPEEHHFYVQDLLPGVMYNANFQCQNFITKNARECDIGSTCDSLNCYIPQHACILTHIPPADGTYCGENMWCHNQKCLVVGERPGAIDGNWGEWSAWSDCSRSCGSGVASSVRNCDKPQPSHGGKNCVGERIRYKICAAVVMSCIRNFSNLITFISEEVNISFVGKPCETGRPSFRDIQCGQFNDWIYPEDGKVHTWVAYFSHDDNPCILFCINEEKQVAALKPRVIDGTMCYRGIRDICVGGICKTLPCDLHLESNAVEDACGVCHGDGTACEFSEGTETMSKQTKGLTKLVNIPSGTRNIKVEQLFPTSAKIMVMDRDTKDVYVSGSLGMWNVPGSQAWLGMIKKDQDALNIPGPVTKPLSIWILRVDNVTVKWSMALPAEQPRKPEFTWDFLKWGPCSANCGPGTQTSKPSCMEGKAGLVEDSFCADLEMPPAKVRQCEIIKCEPRWMVGDWKGCEHPETKNKGRKRIVYCIKPIGEGEGESQIVPDSECPKPKPHDRESCEKRRKRKVNDYDRINVPGNCESRFETGNSEFSFLNDDEHYMSHSIPFNLMASPHFKHHFYSVEEVPHDKSFTRQEMGDTLIQRNPQENVKSLGNNVMETMDGESTQQPNVDRLSKWLIKLKKSRLARNRDVMHKLILRERYDKDQISPIFTKIIQNPNLNDRSQFINFVKKCQSEESSNDEMTKLRKLTHYPEISCDRGFAQVKHCQMYSKIRPNETSDIHDKHKLTKTRKVLYGSNARMDLKNQEELESNYQWTSRIPKWISKRRRMLKRKRSSRMWKKPKSKDGITKIGKEQNPNSGGYESKNYLNNLFRETHPKKFNGRSTKVQNRITEMQKIVEKPIIKEGVLVIDKDSAENQEMEILFDGDETEEERRKLVKVPQSIGIGKRLTIKDQDVFNLFRELQDDEEDSAFYGHRTNRTLSAALKENNLEVAEGKKKSGEGNSKKSETKESEEKSTKDSEEKSTKESEEKFTKDSEEKSTTEHEEKSSTTTKRTTTTTETTTKESETTESTDDEECEDENNGIEQTKSSHETTTESKGKEDKKRKEEKKKEEKTKKEEDKKEKHEKKDHRKNIGNRRKSRKS